MQKYHKYIVYGLIGLGVILVMLLLGWAVGGSIVGLFAGGSWFDKYRRESRQAQERISKNQDEINKERETVGKQERAALDAIAADYAHSLEASARKADKIVDSAKTRIALEDRLDQELREHEAFLDKVDRNKNGSGFVAVRLLCAIVAMGLTMVFAAQGHSHDPPLTPQERAKVKRLIRLLDRYKATVQRERRRCIVEKKAIEDKERLNCKAQLTTPQELLKACEAQKTILAKRKCPARWPSALITGVVVAGVCGAAFGINEGLRAIK